MFKTIRSYWQERINERKSYIFISQSQTEIVKFSLYVFFVSFMFVASCFIIIHYYLYDKTYISWVEPYVVAISYGGLLGVYLYKTITSYFVNSQETKMISIDTLSEHLKNSKYNISGEIFKKLDAYNAEVDKENKAKLLRNLSKEIDLEISLLESKNLGENKKITYLKVIGVLIDIIKTKGLYSDQSQIIEEIFYSYEGERSVQGELGLSQTNLDKIFGEANKLLSNAKARKTALRK